MKNKKNIWIINQYAGSPKHGMNFRSYYIARELVKNGYEVTIFSGSYSHLFKNPPKVDSNFTKESVDGIDYIWVKLKKYNSSKSFGRLWSMIVFFIKLLFFRCKLMKKPDIIIISSLSLFPVINAYLWSKLYKIDFIFEVRDIWPLTLIELGNTSKYNPLVIVLGWIEKFGYKKAKYVVSLLPKANLHMQKRGLDLQKYVYIPNGVNLEELQNPKELDRLVADKIPKDKFIVGYAGTIGIANAMEYLIDSAKLLQDIDDIYFVIVGDGGNKSNLKSKANSLDLKNIIFIDAIDKREIQSLLQYFDLCYIGWHRHSLYKYGISANKIFDYMYSAKPIVHSVDAGNDPISESGCGITVEPESASNISDAILKIYNLNIDERLALGQKGKEYILDNHLYEKLVKKYIDLI